MTSTTSPQEPKPYPREVSDALLSILDEGILNIRMASNADEADVDYCAMESNHLHQIPLRLRNYSRRWLVGYVRYATQEYAREFQKHFGKPPTVFERHWKKQEEYLANNPE